MAIHSIQLNARQEQGLAAEVAQHNAAHPDDPPRTADEYLEFIVRQVADGWRAQIDDRDEESVRTKFARLTDADKTFIRSEIDARQPQP